MRQELKSLDSQRETFLGTFERFGTKSGYRGSLPTILLTNIQLKSTGKMVTDHLWFNLTKGFEKLLLNRGDVVAFDARVKPYRKGYMGFKNFVNSVSKTDYKLSHPTNIKKL